LQLRHGLGCRAASRESREEKYAHKQNNLAAEYVAQLGAYDDDWHISERIACEHPPNVVETLKVFRDGYERRRGDESLDRCEKKEKGDPKAGSVNGPGCTERSLADKVMDSHSRGPCM
jgi:hypothetical protein